MNIAQKEVLVILNDLTYLIKKYDDSMSESDYKRMRDFFNSELTTLNNVLKVLDLNYYNLNL